VTFVCFFSEAGCVNLKEIKRLWKARKFEKALAKIEKLLARYSECPHLWNLRGDLIQLLETPHGPALAEAAKSYKMALRLNPQDLEALENLAHFYDVVIPRPASAKKYARAYIAKAKRGLREMECILTDGMS
jgi:tetratricopeptide (TPR) repeat protein